MSIQLSDKELRESVDLWLKYDKNATKAAEHCGLSNQAFGRRIHNAKRRLNLSDDIFEKNDIIKDDELRKNYETWLKYDKNAAKAAEHSDISASTLKNRLKLAKKRLGVDISHNTGNVPLSKEELQKTVDVWSNCEYNNTKTIKQLGISRTTLSDRLDRASFVLGIDIEKNRQRKIITDDDLRENIEIYYKFGGDIKETANYFEMSERSMRHRLKKASEKLNIIIGDIIAGGSVNPTTAKVIAKPTKGKIKRYILSSLQNNTHLHPDWKSLLTLNDWLDGLPNSSCELMIGTFSYQKATWGKKAVKRGTHNPNESNDDAWYAPDAEAYIVDEKLQLAKGLIWCGHMNILPTAKNPLVGFEGYNARNSNIIPHAKIAMESVASMPDEGTKMNFSTGTIGQINYVQKKAGILAEQGHDFGAVLVEVQSDGSWYVRQLYIDNEGYVYDIGPAKYGKQGGIRAHHEHGVEFGNDETFIEAVNWGDVHAAELDDKIKNTLWNPGGAMDQLRPKYQFMHDVYSHLSRTHHEIRNFHKMYQKHVTNQNNVEKELKLTADLLNKSYRKWNKIVIVPSNHHDFLERWLNESDFRADPMNAKFFCLAQYNILDAIDKGDNNFNVFEWAMKRAGCPDNALFLKRDESFVICKTKKFEGIECALHGDDGPNGARGSTRNLAKMGRCVSKGHDHSAAIVGRVFSAGSCVKRFGYMSGPGSHSISHIVAFKNGHRQIITMWKNQFRASY